MNLLKKLSNFVIGGLESTFYRWGVFVCLHPYPVILISAILSALTGLGLLRFRQESQANLLWIPPWSQYNVNEDWLDDNFKNNRRDQFLLYKADNVLTPLHLQQMYELQQRISDVTVHGKTFNDICTKIPVASIFHKDEKKKRRRKRETLRSESLVLEELKPSFLQTLPPPTLENLQTLEGLQANSEQDLPASSFKDQVATTETSAEYDYEEEYYDLWPEYDEQEYSGGEDDYVEVKARIDYDLYGRDNVTGEAKAEPQLPNDIKCGIVAGLKEKCLQSNLLEIWRYREELIYSATQQEILNAINLLERSPWTSHKMNFMDQLGGITRNSTGHVIAAQSAQMYWNIAVPEDAVLLKVGGGGLELNPADATTLAWEERFLDIALNSSYPDVSIYPNAAKSFGDISGDAIFFDALKMAGGYMLMFIYTILMLGKLNTLELRLYLSIAGIISVGMGLGIGIGLSSALGYPYTPLHSALPFLCLGIGIDDMFVIVQCWYNMKKVSRPDIPLSEAVGTALKHAGVSVTITTLTDVMAFGAGAVTRMPGLESFCVCTALALAAIYLLQISWFVAFLALDEKRIKSGRDGLIPCLVHKNHTPAGCSSVDLTAKFLTFYSKLLSKWVYKVFIILVSLGFLGVGAWGATLIKQKFDPVLLLPSESYLRKWLHENEVLYPSNGWSTPVYTGPLDHNNMQQMDDMVNQIQSLVDSKMYMRYMDSWWTEMKHFANNTKNYGSWKEFATPENFPTVLGDFLYTGDGAKYKNNFIWDGELACGEPAPPILASKFNVGFYKFDGPEEHIPAKQALDQIVAGAKVSEVAFSHVKIFAAWETDEIIGTELYRNIGLAMLAVAFVTLILIANIQICVLVLMCVSLTLADIIGFLHFWDMTIDVTSCISIVLAIGLCVDYSVHIAHAYLIAPGSRLSKSVYALTTIGPAVFNGGFTTFLAVVLLGASQSQVFITFFKVFFLTVTFGQFHGLVLLPVLLTIFGPLHTDPSSISNSSVMGSTVSPASSSGQNSPQTPGHNNLGYIQDVGISVISTDSLDKPRIKNIFGKKGSWNLDSVY